MSFKVGDEVICIEVWGNTHTLGQKGKIICIGAGCITVEFYNLLAGCHDGNSFGRGQNGDCWNFSEDTRCLKITKKIKIKPFGIVAFCNKYYLKKRRQDDVDIS
jgi:hypothetical protein